MMNTTTRSCRKLKRYTSSALSSSTFRTAKEKHRDDGDNDEVFDSPKHEIMNSTRSCRKLKKYASIELSFSISRIAQRNLSDNDDDDEECDSLSNKKSKIPRPSKFSSGARDQSDSDGSESDGTVSSNKDSASESDGAVRSDSDGTASDNDGSARESDGTVSEDDVPVSKNAKRKYSDNEDDNDSDDESDAKWSKRVKTSHSSKYSGDSSESDGSDSENDAAVSDDEESDGTVSDAGSRDSHSRSHSFESSRSSLSGSRSSLSGSRSSHSGRWSSSSTHEETKSETGIPKRSESDSICEESDSSSQSSGHSVKKRRRNKKRLNRDQSSSSSSVNSSTSDEEEIPRGEKDGEKTDDVDFEMHFSDGEIDDEELKNKHVIGSPDPPPSYIIPQDEIEGFRFSDYMPGSYERVAHLKKKWLEKSFNSEIHNYIFFQDECTPVRFCQCHRPSKRAEFFKELKIPVLFPSHLSELEKVAQKEKFPSLTFHGKTFRLKSEECDYQVTYHNPKLHLHKVPPLLTHARSLNSNRMKGVAELVGVDVEKVAVVTRFAGYSLLHFMKDAPLTALELLDVLCQVMKIALHLCQNNYVHNSIRYTSVCLTVTNTNQKTKMREFNVALKDLTLCRPKRRPLFQKEVDSNLYPWLCPEIVRGAPCSEYSDVYSVGRLVKHLETREHPYPNDIRNWVTEATSRRSLSRPSLHRGLKCISKFRKTLLKLYKDKASCP